MWNIYVTGSIDLLSTIIEVDVMHVEPNQTAVVMKCNLMSFN